jgi:hypothetical protein
MLVDEPMVLVTDPILAIISKGKGNSRIETGCYQVGHFGSSDFLPKYEQYPILSIDPYGVCDSLEQLKAKCPELIESPRRFVVVLTEIRKDEQPSSYGWRWHKWGEYIGEHEIECEYLADEEGIDRVFCYHIYEKI